jgi:beta-lactamase regulating signal transducer with metallopeptidase domain
MIEALGWAFLHSLWIGTVIWLGLRFYQTKVSNQKPSRHYNLLLLGQVLLASGTLAAFFLSYEKPNEAAFYGEFWGAYEVVETAFVQEDSISDQSIAFIRQQAPWFGLIWILGVLVLSVKWLAGWSYMQWLKQKATVLQDYEIERQVKRIARSMGIHQQIEIRLSDSLFGPCTLGFWRPIIMLPASILTGLSPEQIYGILAHEMAHIKRHDYLINIFQSMLDILFFYHPAQYWMSKHSREAREQCCDDMAIEATGNRMIYARALAEVAGAQLKPLSPATAFQEGKSQLLVRIQRLFGAYRARSKTRLAGIGWASLLVLALGSAYWPVVHGQSPQSGNEAVIITTDQEEEGFPFYREGETDIASEETSYVPEIAVDLEGMDETLRVPGIKLNLEGLDKPLKFPEMNLNLNGLAKLNLPEAGLSLEVALDTPPPMPPMPPMPPIPQVGDLPPMPPMPPMPSINFSQDMNAGDSMALENWGKEMEAFGERMEAWGEQFGEQWEAWGEQFGQEQAPHWEKWAEKMEAWGESFGEKFGDGYAEKMEAMGRRMEREAERQEQEMERAERYRERAERMREQSEVARARAEEMAERQRENAERMREREVRRAEERERFRRNSVVDRTQEILAQLKKDGYVNDNARRVKVKVKSDRITVNGKQVDGDDEAKYRRMFWPDVCNGCTSEMTISN